MALANINVRVEPEAKVQFEDFCSKIGMSMSTAINVFIKATLREKKIPFEIAVDSDTFYSPENMARLERSAHQIESGQIVTKSMDELQALTNG